MDGRRVATASMRASIIFQSPTIPGACEAESMLRFLRLLFAQSEPERERVMRNLLDLSTFLEGRFSYGR